MPLDAQSTDCSGRRTHSDQRHRSWSRHRSDFMSYSTAGSSSQRTRRDGRQRRQPRSAREPDSIPLSTLVFDVEEPDTSSSRGPASSRSVDDYSTMHTGGGSSSTSYAGAGSHLRASVNGRNSNIFESERNGRRGRIQLTEDDEDEVRPSSSRSLGKSPRYDDDLEHGGDDDEHAGLLTSAAPPGKTSDPADGGTEYPEAPSRAQVASAEAKQRQASKPEAKRGWFSRRGGPGPSRTISFGATGERWP